MALNSASPQIANVKDGDKSISGDLEEGEIEDGELPEDEDEANNVQGKKEILSPPKIDGKVDKGVEREEKRSDLPLNRSSNRRKPLHTPLERIKDPSELEEEWACVVEKQLKAAMCMDSSPLKANGIAEKSSEKSVEEDTKNRKTKRKNKEEEERRDPKKRKRSHWDDDHDRGGSHQEKSHDSVAAGGGGGDEKDENDDGDDDDDDEMLFVRGASPTIKSTHKDDTSPKDNFKEKGYPYKQGSGFDENYDSYNEDDSDYEGREDYGRSDDEGHKRGLNRGVKHRQRSVSRAVSHSKRQVRKDSKSKRDNIKRQSSSRSMEREPNICMFFMQGKCQKGEDCPYSHNACPPRKMELCKFYLMDCCAKKDKCLYMHHDFPCKFYHTGLKCFSGSRCKFSHSQLSDAMRNILLKGTEGIRHNELRMSNRPSVPSQEHRSKHLETAPKELLGDFPRLSREGAAAMVYKKSRSKGKKIPSLFDIEVPIPVQLLAEQKDSAKDQSPRRTPMPDSENEDLDGSNTPMPLSPVGDSKSKGKSHRWSSDEASAFSPPSHVKQIKIEHDSDKYSDHDDSKTPLPRFYQETNEDSTLNYEKERTKSNHRFSGYSPNSSDEKTIKKETAPIKKETVPIKKETVSVKKETVPIKKETILIKKEIEDIDNNDDKEVKRKLDDEKKIPNDSVTACDSGTESNDATNVPLHLPKKQRELFLRIQQQQREAESSQAQTNDCDEEMDKIQEDDWYSSEDEEDSLTNVLKNLSKQNQQTTSSSSVDVESSQSTSTPLLPLKILPDFSKIDISESFTKLLTSLCCPNPSDETSAHPTSSSPEQTPIQPSPQPAPQTQQTISSVARDPRLSRDPRSRNQASSLSSNTSSIFSAPSDIITTSSTSTTAAAVPSIPEPVRRTDPRRADPRSSKTSRSDMQESKNSGNIRRNSSNSSTFLSIYSNAIMADPSINTGLASGISGDIDLRNFLPRTSDIGDVDLRHGNRVDTDLRTGQPPTALSFGDTDLRVRSQDILSVGQLIENRNNNDVDLRKIITIQSLPFKPVPMHTPATEIKASLTSHPPIPYKVVVVTIPRPDYTSLKLNTSDPQVQNDPRLRKIFKLDNPAPENSARNASTPGITASRNDPRRQSARAISISSGVMNNTEHDHIIDQYTGPLTVNSVTKPIVDVSLGIPNATLMSQTSLRSIITQNPLLSNTARVGRDPRNAPGLLGPAPLPINFCPTTPMFEDHSDSLPGGDGDPRSIFNRGSIDMARWEQQTVSHLTNQNTRNNWRTNRRNQQSRYVDQDFSQGSFTPPT